MPADSVRRAFDMDSRAGASSGMPAADAARDRHEPLVTELLNGHRTALARAISVVENQRPGFEGVLARIHPHVGRSHRIGVTGPPGAGKSTLSAALVSAFRAAGQTVGIVAVDPTSAFTGGALLGDRIRMNDVALDRGVYIRSMATRGSLGGMAGTTEEVADVMDAFGFDRIIIETVGVGQSELDVAAATDSTIVVLVPESGDSIQAMKAGLMEIADLFVINKADRPGAERVAREIEMVLHLRSGATMRNVPAHHGVDLKRVRRRKTGAAAAVTPAEDEPPLEWSIPVLQTVAANGQGVPAVAEALDRHRAWLQSSGELARRRAARLADRVREVVARSVNQRVWIEKDGEAILRQAMPEIAAGTLTPYEAAARIVGAGLG
jgi:LAO/AO transport system kinase